jgi:membrane-associated phospholipid phosphatase
LQARRWGPERLLGLLALLLSAVVAAACATGRRGCILATSLGSEGLYFLLGVLVYAWLDGLLGAAGVASAALAASATVLLKQLLETPRPPYAAAVGATGPGFPSGHTAVVTGFWLGMGLYSGSPLLSLGGTLLGALVGYTRVAIGAHYPGDVLGGFIVGAASAYTVARLARDWGVLGAAAVSSLAGLEAAVLAAILEPGYRASWRLAGIDAGLAAAGLLLAQRGLEKRLRGRPTLACSALATALPLAVLAAAVGLEYSVGPLAGAAGFAAFSSAAIASRVPRRPCAPRRRLLGARR